MDIIEHSDQVHFSGLTVTELAKQHLMATAKWARILAIIGFLVIGTFILLALGVFLFISGSDFFEEMNEMNGMNGMAYVFGPSIFFIYLLIGLIYLYPLYKLYKFSKLAISACENDNDLLLEAAFEHQKSLFKFVGIISIVIIAIYTFTLLMMVVFGLSVMF